MSTQNICLNSYNSRGFGVLQQNTCKLINQISFYLINLNPTLNEENQNLTSNPQSKKTRKRIIDSYGFLLVP